MCATCGCSDDSRATLTDLQTGVTVALENPDQPTLSGSTANRQSGAHPHHAHHDHAGGHDHHTHHAHAHEHGHTHAHDHHAHDHHRVHEAPADGSSPASHLAPTRSGTIISLEQQILAKNDRMAQRNRGWFAGRKVLAVNLVSAPGAGKTTLLERTIRDLGPERLRVIEGDQQTLHDARRIQAAGARTVQINTGTACHLDADMVARAIEQLDPPTQSILFIENVGNLVCPALFDLGERSRVVIVSVTEGEDKPIKYPHMFRSSSLMILNKIDLLPYVAFDVQRCLAWAREVNPALDVIQVSATRGDGLDEWYQWLNRQVP